MAFEDCDGAMDKRYFLQLKEDKDSADVVFLQEPRPRETRGFTKGSRTVACFPIATVDGVGVWTRGYEDKNRLKAMWSDLQDKQVRVVRHGKPGDKKTTYEITPKKMTKQFRAIVDSITDEDIEEMFNDIGKMVD